MYAMTCTRPDVSFALSMVSRHQQNPGEGHWTTVKNILRYLRNTKDRFLVYGGEKELRVVMLATLGLARHLNEMGNAAYKNKEFDKAFEFYSGAIELDEDDISFLTNRAAVYMETRKIHKYMSKPVQPS
ncbi:retrotransposon protein, putative, ty1-copia subclass [Tanacetum coccineum]